MLHPPYTTWHLSYVVIGASLAPVISVSRLVATVLAFFLAVGIAAHALDELNGRPLRTAIRAPVLVAAAALGLAGAVGLGVAGVVVVGWALVPFLCVGPAIVLAYNLELFGGVFHNDATFAIGWGGFPVLTAYVAEAGNLAAAPVVAALAASALSVAQRRLSTPARMLRRRTALATGSVSLVDGSEVRLDQSRLLAPLEHALRAMAWSIALFAAAFAIARLS